MEDNKTLTLKILLKLKINQQHQNQQFKQETIVDFFKCNHRFPLSNKSSIYIITKWGNTATPKLNITGLKIDIHNFISKLHLT